MTGRFAGSRSLDERRRRRIAGEQENPGSAITPTPSDSAAPIPANSPPPTPRRKTRRLPLRLIISPRYWKHIFIGVLLFAVGAAILWAGVESDTIRQQAGPDLQSLVVLSSGKLTAAFGSLLLLLASQLAMLICFVRARSHTDFSGRYRIWGWAAPVGFLASASVALNLHHVWSRSLAWWLQMEFQKLETLCWLAPTIGCGSVLLRDILADMRKCRASTVALWLALLCWTAACIQILGFGVNLPDRFLPLAISGMAMLGHYFLFISLMLHARYVIFVSAEPAALRPALWKTAFQKVAANLRAKRAAKRNRKALPKTLGEATPNETDSSNGRTAKPTRKKPAVAKTQTAPSETKPAKTTTRSTDNPPSSGMKVLTKTKNGKTFRFDEPHELEEVAGMSKRERRRLRKQKQSQQRQKS